MADAHDPHEEATAKQVRALTARVARLESDLAALQRSLGAPVVEAADFTGITAANAVLAPPPPAPPPPPLPSFSVAAEGTDQARAEAWIAAAPPTGSGSTASPHISERSFENRLGSQIFNRVGIVLLLMGTAWFLKLAVDRRWIIPTPAGRVVAGLIAGGAIVLWSERFRRKGFAAFSYSMKALGSGVLYLTLWAAFQLFHLLPASAALGMMVLVTAWNAYMAWSQDSELLAAYALAGGFLTPMLVSTGGNHEVFLFTYLLAIDLATVLLVRLKPWPRLLLGAFPLTMIYFVAWYSRYYEASALMTTSLFILLFDCTFSSVPVGNSPANGGSQQTRTSTLIEDILLPLSNAAFLSLSLYSVLEDSGHHALLPWLMILLAAVYLAFMRLPQTRTASAIHLSIAIVFLTIAIPLKASGHWITASWLVEGLALLWAAARLQPGPTTSEDGYAAQTLRLLGTGALLLGFFGVVTHEVGSSLLTALPLFNADMGTALTGVAVFAGAAWLGLGAGSSAANNTSAWPKIAMGSVGAIAFIATLLTLREVGTSWSSAGRHGPFESADFFTALIALAIFAGVVRVALGLSHTGEHAFFWARCAALCTVAFNVIAVLTGVRELAAIWERYPRTDEGVLQQALAISGFLMLYGAALLAVGFWKRSAFLRWQALLLLTFTIFKTFLYDMRSLSQGYRVASFLALGALLMAISFAYQKDWLGLRVPQGSQTEKDPFEAAR